jgi:hypothetical protein
MAGKESFEEGGATVLNISSEGMLLHVPKSYDPGAIIELSLPDPRNRQFTFTTILEARWAQSNNKPDRHIQHLVGCRTLYACFSPSKPTPGTTQSVD